MRALFVIAHPDDEVLGCCGVLARHANCGDEIRVAFLAEGVTARFNRDELDSPEVRELSRRRNQNAIRALRLLGISEEAVFVAERFCCRLDEVPQIELVKSIEQHIRQFKPERIYTHAAFDTNVDHRITHRAVIAAARPVWPFAIEILTFEVLSSTEWNPSNPFSPTFFVDIAAYLDSKIAALAAYEDEMKAFPHSRSEEAVRALATFRGVQAGLTCAEAFEIVRMINR